MDQIRKVMLVFFVSSVLLSFCSVGPVCQCVSAAESGELASFKTGYFYASITKDDGVLQLTECTDVTKASVVTGGKPFDCAPEGEGVRCTGKGLDVIFVFKDLKTCKIDHDKTLDSEED